MEAESAWLGFLFLLILGIYNICMPKNKNSISMNISKILLVGVLAIPVMGSAQVSTNVEPRNAVLEEWTGIHCGYCPTGHAAVQTAVDNNPGRVVALNIHSGGYAVPSAGEPDYRTPEGTIHDAAFPISGYPSSTLNRRTISGSQTYPPASSNNPDKVPAVLAENSEVNIYIDATADMNTRVLTVNVEYYYTSDAPNATNYLNVAILQNNVLGPQSDYSNNTYNPDAWVTYPTVYRHGHVFRGFITGQWGDAINATTTGSTGTMSYTQTLPTDINGVALNIADIEIAAYIGDGFEAAGNVLTGEVVSPYLTGFPTNDEVIYISGEVPIVSECSAGANVTLTPNITLQNWGSNPITTATVTYDMNGGASQIYTFNDVANPINPGQNRTFDLDPISFSALSSNTMNVTVSDPNGVPDVTANNSGTVPFAVNIAAPTNNFVIVELTTDDAAAETYIEIRDMNSNLIWSEGNEGVEGNFGTGNSNAPADPTNPLANNTSYSWQVYFPWLTCYSVIVYDYFGDGLANGTVGSYNIIDHNGAIVISESATNFGGSDASLVTVGVVGLEEADLNDISVYPNPASDVLNVTFNSDGNQDYTVAILDIQGRVLLSESGSMAVAFDVSELAIGSYIVKVFNDENVYTQNLVIK